MKNRIYFHIYGVDEDKEQTIIEYLKNVGLKVPEIFTKFHILSGSGKWRALIAGLMLVSKRYPDMLLTLECNTSKGFEPFRLYVKGRKGQIEPAKISFNKYSEGKMKPLPCLK